jgi:hypothetical protein
MQKEVLSINGYLVIRSFDRCRLKLAAAVKGGGKKKDKQEEERLPSGNKKIFRD